jgi:micrococcal nuclease
VNAKESALYADSFALSCGIIECMSRHFSPLTPHHRTVVYIFALVVAFGLGFLVRDMESAVDSTPEVDLPSTSAVDELPSASLASSSDLHLESSSSQFFSVVRVVDGDTIVIAREGRNETLRLIGVNTPETVDPRRPVECFGKEASAFATRVLSGAEVRVEGDPSQGEKDKYGRTLAYLFLSDGTFFNLSLVREGYAYEYTYNEPYRYQKEFRDAERSARAEGKGLWAEGACRAAPPPSSLVPEAPALLAPVSLLVSDSSIECARNVYNCADLATQSRAQEVFDQCGGVANDVHRLDRDGDGRVCESLP